MKRQQQRYPLNQGDFYINNGQCITCGAPQAEAPDVVEHGPDGHCYFKKQPSTEMELDQAINAMMVSCIDALRYGGSDERILKRLYQNNMAHLCDVQPKELYAVLVRDTVHFSFDGTLNQLSELMVNNYKSIAPYVRVEDFTSNSLQHFSFAQRWTEGKNGVKYDCSQVGDQTFKIKITLESGNIRATIGIAAMLHDFIAADSRVSNINWFEIGREGLEWYEKPY